MAKFYGTVGYVIREKTKPGVWEDKVTERQYYGDYVRFTSSRTESTDGVNDNIVIENNISIVADPYAYEHFHHIKYIKSEGIAWKVTKVDPQYPRIILTTGGVYNGKQA